MHFVILLSAVVTALVCSVVASKDSPNIVFIFTDDQDYRHGSLDSMKAVQQELVAKGTLFTNFYATIAVCCPSRVSLMRGQAAHNTNNTHVRTPGGGYGKFLKSAEDNNYLPHWLDKAGYRTEYIGKLFNGVDLTNYSPAPKGWDHIDVLLDPYINAHNTVVMSQNGDRPKWYRGYQQTDVLRIKALSRLEALIQEEDPFFLMIAPTAPHVENVYDPPTPPARYLDKFANRTAPRAPNYNPPDEFQHEKPAWLGKLPLLNQTQIDQSDRLFRRRLESLQGVDDIVDDVVQMLKDKGVIEETYVIYSTDQGYHLGTHRQAAGKSTPYLEDTNIPLVVRGPGIQLGATSNLPGTITDFAPTFLDIAGLADEDYPPFLDGSSLLDAWKDATSPALSQRQEAINIEFWGYAFNEIPAGEELHLDNDYKTMRVVGEKSSWMYSRWCNDDTELYNITADPHELLNLANASDPAIQRVLSRMNALLMVGKSCAESSCREPWSVLQPPNAPPGQPVLNLEEALNPDYDEYYSAIPQVKIEECLGYQFTPNEGPFFPSGAEEGLGLQYREPTDNYEAQNLTTRLAGNEKPGGDWDQRHATLEMLQQDARELTNEELKV
ncbi:uncharacterized protein K452DRAFT_344391 [Aplosporella prunicola CBS 121167]|uniref:Sulfatase N-terminal domain-containing protein n=1 Tax=Aplosporella prunicola CBS 121167 TaxID=1176127 RepID=A0A6A6BL15_9PEZI|nr:uncharacterized protein K452DRAFT_344391 [Aplosporella prunicola CBS 121167]KAF2144358.1 hypothetical protein K452DRAFT_344391 [Aplosporella prunicola CBS 121167]